MLDISVSYASDVVRVDCAQTFVIHTLCYSRWVSVGSPRNCELGGWQCGSRFQADLGWSQSDFLLSSCFGVLSVFKLLRVYRRTASSTPGKGTGMIAYKTAEEAAGLQK